MLTARRIEEAEDRLRDLRREEWSDLLLAALVMGLALGASLVHSPFEGPLFVGVRIRQIRAGFEERRLAA
jgi:hypothetical protein